MTRSLSSRYADLNSLQASVAELTNPRILFEEVATRHEAGDATIAELELPTSRLRRHTAEVKRNLQRCLSTVKIYYSILWSRVHAVDEDPEDFDNDDEHWDRDAQDSPENGSLVDWALDTTAQHLKNLISDSGKTYEGRSPNHRVTAVVDNQLDLVNLDIEPDHLTRSDYRAAIIEAINNALEPAFFRSTHMADMLIDGPDPKEEAPLDPSPETGPVTCLLYALEDISVVEGELAANILPEISLGDRATQLEDLDLLAKWTREGEEHLRKHIPSLRAFQQTLDEMLRVEETTAEQLAKIAHLEPIFLEDDLDDFGELEGWHGIKAAREIVETVTEELRRQAEERESRRSWQMVARRQRQQIAEVERQHFEGRSGDRSVTAFARGSVQLVDLKIVTEDIKEPAALAAAIIEAVNGAVKEARHRRTCAAMIAPP